MHTDSSDDHLERYFSFLAAVFLCGLGFLTYVRNNKTTQTHKKPFAATKIFAIEPGKMTQYQIDRVNALTAQCFNRLNRKMVFDEAILAMCENVIVGCALLRRARCEMPEHDVFFLESLCVDKYFRRNGIGSKILYFCNVCLCAWTVLYVDAGPRGGDFSAPQFYESKPTVAENMCCVDKLVKWYSRHGYRVKTRPLRFAFFENKVRLCFISVFFVYNLLKKITSRKRL